jgi:hypothetical protein
MKLINSAEPFQFFKERRIIFDHMTLIELFKSPIFAFPTDRHNSYLPGFLSQNPNRKAGLLGRIQCAYI